MDFAADALLLHHAAEEHLRTYSPPAPASPPHSASPAPPRKDPQSRSPARRARRDSWHMWLTSRVGAAEAALATVFVGGAALAASPRGKRSTREERAAAEDDEVLPPLPGEAPALDLALSEAWSAVRRAAAAAMATFDGPAMDRDGDECGDAGDERESDLDGAAAFERSREGGTGEDSAVELEDGKPAGEMETDMDGCVVGGSSCTDGDIVRSGKLFAELSLCDVCEDDGSADGAAPEAGKLMAEDEIEYSEITASSSLGDGVSRRDSNVPSCPDESVHCTESIVKDDLFLEPLRGLGRETATTAVALGEPGQSNVEANVTGDVPEPLIESQVAALPGPQNFRHGIDPESVSRLTALRKQFNSMFEQNGGAECVARVKQIGDDALIGMRDTADMDHKVMAELDDAKLILDDALRRLDAAVRSKVNEEHPEYADAAAAATSVIDETKENVGARGNAQEQPAADFVADGSRLLAVFATKICASVVECLESDKARRTWSERVEKLAEISTMGVSQLRTVSSKFAVAICRVRSSLSQGEDRFDATACWPVEMEKLNEAAIGHVLQCVALAIAALQIEAAERAHACSF